LLPPEVLASPPQPLVRPPSAAPLFKRPTKTKAAPPPAAAVIVPPPPPQKVLHHACTLSCPACCPGWVGLANLLQPV
jgi:hypothetical protein